MPAHHQSGSLRYLAEKWNGKVFGIFDTKLSNGRKSLGWEVPDLGSIKSYFLDGIDSPEVFVENFIKAHTNSIHVVCGVRGTMCINMAWDYLGGLPNSKIACILERPHYHSWQGHLKKIWYWKFFREHAKMLKTVLAMGKMGVDSYQKLGISTKVLFPFMYQSDFIKIPKSSKFLTHDKPLRFVYIGQFIERKGADILSAALEKLPDSGWTMDWIGTGGEFEKHIQEQSKEINKICFLGYCSSNEIPNRLSKYDVAIIPSRHDGWGMVVNEALLAGLGVIVTNQVGAKDLIEASQAGVVIKAGSIQTLVEGMTNAVDNYPIVNQWKSQARQYRSLLNAERAGQYLHDVLHYSFVDPSVHFPEPYWLNFNL